MQSSQIIFKYLWLNKKAQLNGPLDTQAGVAVDGSQSLFRWQKLFGRPEKKGFGCFELAFAFLSDCSENNLIRKCWQLAEEQMTKV